MCVYMCIYITPNPKVQEMGAAGTHPLQRLIETEVKRRFKSRGTGSLNPDMVRPNNPLLLKLTEVPLLL